MNTTIADLISEIDWANDTANWANSTLRLPYMDLANAYFVNAHLVGADFRHANLNGADLRYADLRHADLSSAWMSSADLEYADLNGADLTGVYWYNTTCPDGTNSDNNGNTCENNL